MLGSCLMIGLKGPSLLKEEKQLILSENISSVILFKRNILSLKQVFELCLELKALLKPPLLIAMDREGGEVDRLSHLKGLRPWPSAKTLGPLDPKVISSLAEGLGQQMKLLNIDINLAPVVDLLLNQSPLLETRVFSKKATQVLSSALAFVEGLNKAQIISCLKHFPGHGGVKEDSHKVLPQDLRTVKDLKPQLNIFKTLFEKQKANWIMTSHVMFPNIDKVPATFSSVLLQKLLREEMNFKGLLISDDLEMSALEPLSLFERACLALKAGCDLLIYSQKPEHLNPLFQKNLKDKELQEKIKSSSQKILKLRSKLTNKTAQVSFGKIKKEFLKLQELSQNLV